MADPLAELKYGVRVETSWNGQRVEVPYLCTNCSSRDQARAALMDVAPSAVLGYPTASGTSAILTLTDTRLEEIPGEGKAWNAWAIYSIAAGAVKTTGEDAFGFETGGSTQTIAQALRHISTTAAAGATTTTNHQGAINVSGDGDVSGVSIPTPAFRFTITMYKSKASVTQTYLENLYKCTGKVNSDSLTVKCNGVNMSFADGELLLEGASGGLRGNQDWEITLRFAASPNVTDVCANWAAAVKPATAVPKKGWEYVWIYYEEFYDATATPPRRIKRPQTINVEQIFETTAFSVLALPS